MPIKIIKEPIYQSHIHFIFDTPKNKVLAYLNKRFKPMNFDDHWEKAGIMYSDDEFHDYFIILPDKKPTWTASTIIAHEAFHVAAKVMQGKGIILSRESEEAYNYYLTWIIQSLTDIYNKHKKNKTKARG
jgi:hypothetical protein